MRGVILFFSILVLVMPLVLVALPQNIALAQESNVTRALPDTVLRGETFNVTVTFTTPIVTDVVTLGDYAPAGWAVQVNKAWCVPPPYNLSWTEVDVLWQKSAGYPVNTTFTVLYKVTVPVGASPGFHNFSEPEKGRVRYHKHKAPPHENWTTEYITDESRVEVIVPEIYVYPSSLAFGAVQGGLTPGNQTLLINNSGDPGTTLVWTLSDDAGWLDENVTSGNSTGEADKALVEVSVNITGMGAGDYSANITVADPLAVNSPQLVPVTLHISSPSSGGGGGGGGSRPRTVRGDVNKDGVVDERDLTLERGIILGLDGATASADVNGDGRIDALDIVAIKRIIVRKE